MSSAFLLIYGLILAGDVAALPLIAWTWKLWLSDGQFHRRASWLSGVGVALATASALLAFGAIVYSGSIG